MNTETVMLFPELWVFFFVMSYIADSVELIIGNVMIVSNRLD